MRCEIGHSRISLRSHLTSAPKRAKVVPMEVRVYRNLRDKCWSIVDKKTGRVHCRWQSVVIDNAKFIVRPAGREKVRREKRKNVHAFVDGNLRGSMPLFTEDFKIPVSYNPYKNETFVNCETGEPVTEGWQVWLRSDGQCLVRKFEPIQVLTATSR